MAGSAKRERQLARERYERQQERRVTAAAKRRRRQQVTAVVVAVVMVIGGVVGLSMLLDDDKDGATAASEPSESPTPATSSPEASPSASGSDGCTYTKTTEPAAKKVAVPTFDAKAAKAPYTATIATNQGDVTVEMDTAAAPCTTNSFKHLATGGYFDKTPCHRLTTDGIFVLQCGDPSGTGSGGPGYGFGVENVPPDGMFPAGTVAMARSQDPNSNGSQFFIVYDDTKLPTEGGGYTIFGRVTKGLDVVEKVAQGGADNANGEGDGKPKLNVEIGSVTIGKA